MTATHERPLGARERTSQPDTGLLSPVRAGTPVEGAVGDVAWLQAMLDAEAALARAQARCGTVPPSAAEAITAAARAERVDVRQVALASRETANPVVALIGALTAAVAEDAPHAVEYVHRGSTSQDIFDTGAMLVAARALRLIAADLRPVADTLAGLAAEHRDTVMAGRTLALHAVPTTEPGPNLTVALTSKRRGDQNPADQLDQVGVADRGSRPRACRHRRLAAGIDRRARGAEHPTPHRHWLLVGHG